MRPVGRISRRKPDPPTEGLDFMRGCLLALLISLPLWAVIIYTIKAVL